MDIKHRTRVQDGGIVCASLSGLDAAPGRSARQPFPIFVLDLTTPDVPRSDESALMALLANMATDKRQASQFLEAKHQ